MSARAADSGARRRTRSRRRSSTCSRSGSRSSCSSLVANLLVDLYARAPRCATRSRKARGLRCRSTRRPRRAPTARGAVLHGLLRGPIGRRHPRALRLGARSGRPRPPTFGCARGCRVSRPTGSSPFAPSRSAISERVEPRAVVSGRVRRHRARARDRVCCCSRCVLLVASLPQWSERQHAAIVAAREAARVAGQAWPADGEAEAERVAREVVDDLRHRGRPT